MSWPLYIIVLTLGISEVKYNVNTNDLSLAVIVKNGQLQPNYIVQLSLNTTIFDMIFIQDLVFGSFIKSHTIDFYHEQDTADNNSTTHVIAHLSRIDDDKSTIKLIVDPNKKEAFIDPSTVSISDTITASNNPSTLPVTNTNVIVGTTVGILILVVIVVILTVLFLTMCCIRRKKQGGVAFLQTSSETRREGSRGRHRYQGIPTLHEVEVPLEDPLMTSDPTDQRGQDDCENIYVPAHERQDDNDVNDQEKSTKFDGNYD